MKDIFKNIAKYSVAPLLVGLGVGAFFGIKRTEKKFVQGEKAVEQGQVVEKVKAA